MRLTKIHRRLRAEGVHVSYSSQYRFARATCDFGTPAITVRMADPPPGEVAETDLGYWLDPSTARRRRVYGLLVTLCFSRYLAISLRQDLDAVLAGLEAAWPSSAVLSIASSSTISPRPSRGPTATRPASTASSSSTRSPEEPVAAGLLRTELDRKAKGLAASPDPRRCLVDDLLEALEARYTTEGRRSVDRLRFSTEHLLRLFKGVQAMRVTGADVLRYAQLRLKENAAAATINRELAALRAAYRLGLDNDVIVAMPRIRLLPENNARKGFADAGQVEAICRSLQPAVADAVRFMFITGWRSRSEVLRLAWGQVDLSGGFVRLEPGTTKNNEGRNFPLIPELRRLLERRQEHTRRYERAQGRIIPEVFHRYGRPIRSMRRAWMTACRKAGRPGLLLHDLRRSAVRNLERAGVSRSVAMKLTGHKTENVYRRYAIVAESDLREAGAKLAATLPDESRSVTHPGQIR